VLDPSTVLETSRTFQLSPGELLKSGVGVEKVTSIGRMNSAEAC
jgi:hypothetical protein